MTSRPSFLGIGAPRCGTTWLHTQLATHPDVWVPPLKELHFFDRSPRYTSPNTFAEERFLDRMLGLRPWRMKHETFKLRRAAGAILRGDRDAARWWARVFAGNYDLDFYASLFPPSGYRAVGEITPSYSILDIPDIEAIRSVNPDMKLIFMIRDPVERAWSSIRYNVGRGRLDLDIENEASVVAHLDQDTKNRSTNTVRGEYISTIKNFLNVFSKEQIIVVFYDAIHDNPSALLEAIADFIGVDPAGFKIREERINASGITARIPEAVRTRLSRDNAAMIDALADQFGSYARRWRDAPDSPSAQEDLRVAIRCDAMDFDRARL